MSFLEILSSVLSSSSDDVTTATPSAASTSSDERSIGFENAWGTAADWQIPAESVSAHPAFEFSTISYGSLDTGISSSDSWSSSSSFNSDI